MEENLVAPEESKKKKPKAGWIILAVFILTAVLLAGYWFVNYGMPREPIASNREEFEAYLSEHFPKFELYEADNGTYIYRLPESYASESLLGLPVYLNDASAAISFSTGGTLTIPVNDRELSANGWTINGQFSANAVNEKNEEINVVTADSTYGIFDFAFSYLSVYPQKENAPRFTIREEINNRSTLEDIRKHIGNPSTIIFYEKGYEGMDSDEMRTSTPVVQFIYQVYQWVEDSTGYKNPEYQYVNTCFAVDAVENILLEVHIRTTG